MFQDVTLGEAYRAIAISDVHGNMDLLQEVLALSQYDPDRDVLFLVGDIMEKGPRSLDTLRYVMDLCRSGRVHPVLGNCDDLLLHLCHGTRLEGIRRYLSFQKHSAVHEMCAQLGLVITAETDLQALGHQLREAFPDEYAFVASMPLAVETEDFIFVHAGLEPRADYRNSDPEWMMAHDQQYATDYVYPKNLVVGHWPVALYHDDVASLSPIIDLDKRMICIDGGNIVKHGGQLNALIMERTDTLRISFCAVDRLPTLRVVCPQESTPGRKVSWPYHALDILHETEDTYTGALRVTTTRGRVAPNIDVPITVPKGFVTRHGDTWYVEECMHAQLPLATGDTVKLVCDGGDWLVCKHAHQLGLVRRACVVRVD